MKIVFGLGNPGEKYKFSRHNAGAYIVSKFAELKEITFSLKSKLKAKIAEFFFNEEKNLIVIPQTFMNLSGECVKKVVDFYKVKNEDILVVYDDFNLPLGYIRIRKKGSSGGHNGVESIISYLNTSEFNRLRIGIKTEYFDDLKKLGDSAVTSFVLGNFSEKEWDVLTGVAQTSCDAIDMFLKGDIDKAMNLYNKRVEE